MWIFLSVLFLKLQLHFFWLCSTACGILAPGPGAEPAPSAVEAQSLNHWATREIPKAQLLEEELGN